MVNGIGGIADYLFTPGGFTFGLDPSDLALFILDNGFAGLVQHEGAGVDGAQSAGGGVWG